MALSLAPVISPVSDVPKHALIDTRVEVGRIEVNNAIELATGIHYADNVAVKGAAGEGITGAEGAIDRITHEILLSLEERKTLVVWLFDGTASLVPQRQAIGDRFSRIYQELGIVEASGQCRLYQARGQAALVVGARVRFRAAPDDEKADRQPGGAEAGSGGAFPRTIRGRRTSLPPFSTSHVASPTCATRPPIDPSPSGT